MWIEHDDQLFNLSQFRQIVRGDPDEILLSTEAHNETWDDPSKYTSMRFCSEEEREKAFERLELLLNVQLFCC